ncbi:MAG: universal stress protein [Methanomicrobiales archaeon]|nr:universal stress protein [Methanomicrobiales archaeon]
MDPEGPEPDTGIFHRVLVSTDFSRPARNTLECVAEMPGVKEVILLHVIDASRPSRHGWIYQPEIENAKILLAEKKERLEACGLRVETLERTITGGDIASSILGTAEEKQVSLIVMGSRGRTLVQGLLLGSVSSEVLRLGKVPLLVLSHELSEKLRKEDCGRRCGQILSRVLCATDFSPSAESCTAFLREIQGVGELILVHVVTKGETRAEIDARVSDARERLEGIAKGMRAAGHRVSPRVHIGDPVHEILSLASEENATLIAMGTVGKNWMRELMVGSTTKSVVRNANRPVLVLRKPPGAQPPASPG